LKARQFLSSNLLLSLFRNPDALHRSKRKVRTPVFGNKKPEQTLGLLV